MALNIEKRYLGDGVYCDFENGMIKLTTENGISVQNTIYLEPQVYTALERFKTDLDNEIEMLRKDAS